jgi:hypothetical protein
LTAQSCDATKHRSDDFDHVLTTSSRLWA